MGVPYPTQVTAVDAQGSEATAQVEWIVGRELREEEGEIEFPVTGFSDALPGTVDSAGYAWLAPGDYGACPVVADVLVARPVDDTRSLLDDAAAAQVEDAAGLAFRVDFATAGDYTVYVCGCAPEYTGEDRQSPRDANDTLFVGLDGAPAVLEDGSTAAALSGFADAEGFTWQNAWLDASTGAVAPVVVRVEEPGVSTVNLWMAEDGLLVHSVKLVHAERSAGAPAGGVELRAGRRRTVGRAATAVMRFKQIESWRSGCFGNCVGAVCNRTWRPSRSQRRAVVTAPTVRPNQYLYDRVTAHGRPNLNPSMDKKAAPK